MQFPTNSSEHAIADHVHRGQVSNGKVIESLAGRAPHHLPVKADQMANQEKPLSIASVPTPSSLRPAWSFSRVMSRVTEYMISDLALGATVLHPETMFMLSETVANNNSLLAKKWADKWAGEPPAERSPLSTPVTPASVIPAAWAQESITGPSGTTLGGTTLAGTTLAGTTEGHYRGHLPRTARPMNIRPMMNQSIMTQGPSTQESFARLQADEIQLFPLGSWLMSLTRSLYAKWQHGRDVRRGMVELSSMDDRSLQDIGISRHEIRQMAQQGRSRH
jgi:uncharacterized protein YjiS (DUF1127 family)